MNEETVPTWRLRVGDVAHDPTDDELVRIVALLLETDGRTTVHAIDADPTWLPASGVLPTRQFHVKPLEEIVRLIRSTP